MEKANNKEALNLNNNYKYITPYTLGLVMSSPTNCPIRIGDLLISTISRNPSEDYVGTEWEQIKDRFLLACGNTYSNGSTGGSSNSGVPSNNSTGSTTLTINQIPSHTHGFWYNDRVQSGSNMADIGAGTNGDRVAPETTIPTGGGQGHTHTLNNHTHSCLPPYLAVYIWKRIK